MIKWFVVCGLLCVAASALAQNQYTPVDPLPLGDVFLSLPTSHMPLRGTWEVRFTHRFNQSIDQGNFGQRIRSLFGLDSSADVGIGLSYVPVRDLQLSVYRSNALGDYELGARYNVFQQAPAIPLSTAVRIGGDWRTQANLNDRTSAFGQIILSRQFGRRAELTLIPTYVTNAGRIASGNTSAALFNHAFNVPVAAALRMTQAMSLIAEVVPRNRDLPSTMHGYFAWAGGIKTVIGGHFFELLLTNSNATHVDQYVTSTYLGSPLRRSDLHLGFNIERRFGH